MRILAFNYNLALQQDKETLASIKKFTPFLDHTIPLISSIHPRKNSSGLYSFGSITEQYHDTREIEVFGEMVPLKKIFDIIQLIAEVDRSVLFKDPQIRNTRYSVAVPWFLYAHKVNNNINYEDWDWNEDSKFQFYALGKTLAEILPYKGQKFSFSDIRELRELAVPEELGFRLKYCGLTELDTLPKALRFMIFQSWVWHPSVRNVNMITTVEDFDKFEPAYFEANVVEKPQQRIEEIVPPWLS